jgi:phospholipase C
MNIRTLALASFVGFASAGAAHAAPHKLDLGKIQHIVVIYEENRSFDNLYGAFPGANGIANAGPAATQVDLDGKPFDHLPAVIDTNSKPPVADTRFPADLPNAPFDAAKYVPMNELTGDLVHRFYQEQIQIDGGRMDKFAAVSDAGGLTMAHYDGHNLAVWKLARQYTLADNFFHAGFGGSFFNHFWLICACAPVFPNAPAGIVAQLDANGHLAKDGAVTPDGHAVNTLFSVAAPHPDGIPADVLLPAQTLPTIGDRLTDAVVSWAWYAGGYSDAMAGHPAKLFQFHHQPFVYFANYAVGKPGRDHLKDGSDFEKDIDAGTLPAVSFYKPVGDLNEHPGYASIVAGDTKAGELIDRIRKSPLWKSTVIIVTHDENGGTWDHVAPPVVDQWGPGTRIPAIVISPFAKRHFIDHTVYDTTSILKFIETRFSLPPLATRDAAANDLTHALRFDRKGVLTGKP